MIVNICVNRCSNDVVRTAFTPDEVCKLTIEFYRRNYIEGLFLSSGILYNANHTMELIYETLHKLRNQWHFNGYIHVKTIPGADSELVERMGFLADRMSINLELPTAEGLKNLAPGKTRDKILKPMRQVQQGIAVSSHLLGYDREFKKTYATERAGFAGGAALIRPELAQPDALLLGNHGLSGSGQDGPGDGQKSMERAGRERRHLPDSRYARTPFVPAGQSTQMIVGATPENDYQMMAVTQALYENYGLKRVFYSAYVPVNDDSCLPSVTARPPLLREHRLYQADWLLRFYGFKAEELLSEEQPNFNVFLDPSATGPAPPGAVPGGNQQGFLRGASQGSRHGSKVGPENCKCQKAGRTPVRGRKENGGGPETGQIFHHLQRAHDGRRQAGPGLYYILSCGR